MLNDIIFANKSIMQFGATVEGIDLNNVDEKTFSALKDAIFRNQLVIIKNQLTLTPKNHFDFVHRFDPMAPAVHGHGTVDNVKKKHDGKSSLLAQVGQLFT